MDIIFRDIWPIIFSNLYDDLFSLKNVCKLFNIIIKRDFFKSIQINRDKLNYFENNGIKMIQFNELFHFKSKCITVFQSNIEKLDIIISNFLKNNEDNYVFNITELDLKHNERLIDMRLGIKAKTMDRLINAINNKKIYTAKNIILTDYDNIRRPKNKKILFMIMHDIYFVDYNLILLEKKDLNNGSTYHYSIFFKKRQISLHKIYEEAKILMSSSNRNYVLIFIHHFDYYFVYF